MTVNRMLARASAPVYFAVTGFFWATILLIMGCFTALFTCAISKAQWCPAWVGDPVALGLVMFLGGLVCVILVASLTALCDPLGIWCFCIPRSYLLAHCRYGPSEADLEGDANDGEDGTGMAKKTAAQSGGM